MLKISNANPCYTAKVRKRAVIVIVARNKVKAVTFHVTFHNVALQCQCPSSNKRSLQQIPLPKEVIAVWTLTLSATTHRAALHTGMHLWEMLGVVTKVSHINYQERLVIALSLFMYIVVSHCKLVNRPLSFSNIIIMLGARRVCLLKMESKENFIASVWRPLCLSTKKYKEDR